MMLKNRWKKAACLILTIISTVCLGKVDVKAADYWPDAPETLSPSVILMEESTGTILYEKNSDEAHYPASITKIMTTLLALENGNLSDMVTFSDDAINNTEGSGIARDYGEQMTLEQCLYGVMLESANECAYAVAEHVGGTVENFVDMMNAKAKELGCTNTHFANPHGLQDENHYTTAHDMALIAQAAYQNETFLLYYGNKKGTRLVKEKVNVRYSSSVSREKALVEQLIKGPDSDNESAVLPEGTKVLSVSVKDHICYVNLDAGFLDTTNVMNPEVPVYAIVNSIVDGSAISRVQILIDGKTDITYMGKINLEKPLSRNPNIVEGE